MFLFNFVISFDFIHPSDFWYNYSCLSFQYFFLSATDFSILGHRAGSCEAFRARSFPSWSRKALTTSTCEAPTRRTRPRSSALARWSDSSSRSGSDKPPSDKIKTTVQILRISCTEIGSSSTMSHMQSHRSYQCHIKILSK